MEWITFYMGERDNVYFITSKSSERDFLKYFKFLEYINNEFKIKDFFEFKSVLDKFKVIILYENGEWDTIPEEAQQVSFQELHRINTVNEEDQKSALDKRVENSKGVLNQMFSFRKDKTMSGYKK